MKHLLCFLLALLIPIQGLAQEPDNAEARALYEEGTSEFEAADYPSAIDAFTRALNLSSDEKVRGVLMLNIAVSHTRQWEIDHDVQRLRQARVIYQRFLTKAEDGAPYSEEDISDARNQMKVVMERIASAEKKEHEKANPPAPESPPTDPLPATPQVDSKARKVGMGTLIPGSAIAVGGLAVLVYGSTFKGRAERDVSEDTMGDPNHPLYGEGQLHIQEQTRRGRILMGVGAAVSVVGLAGVGVGVWQLSKSKKQNTSLSVAVSPDYAGAVFTGRF